MEEQRPAPDAVFGEEIVRNQYGFETEHEEILANAKVGDIVRLDGQQWRVTKKTNYAASVIRYTWIDALTDWITGRKDATTS